MNEISWSPLTHTQERSKSETFIASLPHYTSTQAQYKDRLMTNTIMRPHSSMEKSRPMLSTQAASHPRVVLMKTRPTNPLEGWTPDMGQPKPQTTILDKSFGWSKTDAQRRFHQEFDDRLANPNDNVERGKKNQFRQGIHSQLLHGYRVMF